MARGIHLNHDQINGRTIHISSTLALQQTQRLSKHNKKARAWWIIRGKHEQSRLNLSWSSAVTLWLAQLGTAYNQHLLITENNALKKQPNKLQHKPKIRAQRCRGEVTRSLNVPDGNPPCRWLSVAYTFSAAANTGAKEGTEHPHRPPGYIHRQQQARSKHIIMQAAKSINWGGE